MAKSNPLKKITARAKQIRKRHKAMTWKAAIKKAGAEYRGKKKPVRRKKTVVRKRKRISGIRTNADRVDRKKVNVTIGSVSYHKGQIKKGLKTKIENAAGRRELAIKVNERRKLSKTIAKLKKEYRAYC
jgi:hypothetical protein